MTAEFTPDPELIRRRTVHGWGAFENTAKGKHRVEQYLQDGDPRPLEGTRYAEERLKVVDRLTAAERTELGLGAKQREKKPKLTPPANIGEAAQHVSESLKDDGMKLVVAVTKDGVALMDVNCPPEEAVDLLHTLMHSLIEKIEGPDPRLN